MHVLKDDGTRGQQIELNDLSSNSQARFERSRELSLPHHSIDEQVQVPRALALQLLSELDFRVSSSLPCVY